MGRASSWPVLAALLCGTTPVRAAERACALVGEGGTCSRIIENTGYVSMTGLGAGETVCFRAGSRAENTQLNDLVGSAGAPVMITTCDGVVEIVGRILINHAEHVLVSGALEAPGYGLRIDASGYAAGLGIYGGVTDVEVERVEVHSSAFAGMMVKTDDLPADSAPQANTHLHHNYVHDVRGEGFYVGNSFYGGTMQQRLVGTRIHDNIVVHSGCEGIQLGCADEDTAVFDNYVQDAGAWRDWDLDGEPWDCPVGGEGANCFPQSNAYQLGGGTTGLFFGNVAVGPRAHGLIVLGIGGHTIVNNLFVDVGDYYGEAVGDGIWYSPRLPGDWPRPVAQVPAGDLSYGVVAHNTIVETHGWGYDLHSSTSTTTNLFQNNIVAGYVVDVTSPYDSGAANKHTSKTWVHDGYTHRETVAELGFAAPLPRGDLLVVPVEQRRRALLDAYGLTPGSPAVDGGVVIAAPHAVTTDALGAARPEGLAVDAGAREFVPDGDDGAGGGDADADADGATAADGLVSDRDEGDGDPHTPRRAVLKGGCSCHAAGGGGFWGWLGAPLLWRRRRQRRSV